MSRPFIKLDSVELSRMNSEFLPVPKIGDHVFTTHVGVVESKLFSYYDDYCNIRSGAQSCDASACGWAWWTNLAVRDYAHSLR